MCAKMEKCKREKKHKKSRVEESKSPPTSSTTTTCQLLLLLLCCGALVCISSSPLVKTTFVHDDPTAPECDNQSSYLAADYSIGSLDIDSDERAPPSRLLWRRQVSSADDDVGDNYESFANALDTYDLRRPPGYAADYSTSGARVGRRLMFEGQSPAALDNSPKQQASSPASSSYLGTHQAADEQQQQQKVGPQFIKEPPSLIHYLNSTDLVIPCSAQGSPQPTITWWHKSSQLEIGSLLDKRYVRYDNSLVISAFKAHEYEPDIHSTAYKCQAANTVGTIVSRDVVIKAVMDRDFELSVADQFVAADNDAIFKCQPPPEARDFLQVTGWLEDEQRLTTQVPAASSGWWMGLQQQQQPTPSVNQAGAGQLQQPRAFILPDGRLYIRRVQLADANKSFRCQVKNLLSSKVSLSSVSGRLFVTEASTDGKSGTSPRIVDGPKAISLAKTGEQLLLTCLAQGSPRPTVHWFWRQPQPIASLAAPTTTTGADEWQPLQLATAMNLAAANDTLAASKYVAAEPGGSLLLVRGLQHSADHRSRIKCVASNPLGQHQTETELRLEPALGGPAAGRRPVEVEPRVEHTSSGNLLQRQTVHFNCTIRPTALPLIGVEWLKNGRPLFAISLAEFSSLMSGAPSSLIATSSPSSVPSDFGGGGRVPWNGAPSYEHQLLNGSSLFDDPNQELTVVEYYQPSSSSSSAAVSNSIPLADDYPQVEFGASDLVSAASFADQLDILRDGSSHPALTTRHLQHQHHPQQSSVSSSSLNKLAEQMALEDEPHRPMASGNRGPHEQGKRLRQRLWLLNRDTLMYQLQVDQVRRSDRGSYQCRARNTRTTVHATGHLMLKDNPPRFLETFTGQQLPPPQSQSGGNVRTQQLQIQQQQPQQTSLKCVATGSPLPEISWTLSGFQIPESSRFRVGDYVTRDGLIVSFVNISNVQPEDGGLYECLASNDVGQLRHQAWLNVTGPPHIRPMPNVSAIAGRSLAIMCPAGGWPIEQILWFQNSTKLPVNHRQKLFPNGTLLISDLNEVTDSGQYSCQAKSGASEHAPAVGHTYVSIKVPPVVEPFSFAKSLQRGQRYNVMCTVVRGDLPVSIRWFKDGRALEAPLMLAGGGEPTQELASGEQIAASGGIVVKQLDPYSSTLTFSSLQSHQRGQYTCEATNEAGRANQSSALVIHVPPEWRIEPKDVSVTVGKTAVIDCQADAFPAARIEWRLSQDLFREPPTEFKPIISSLYMQVFENGSLIIYNTQRTDAGYYLCQANNGVGPGLSRVIKLTVHVAAHFKTKIRTELVRRGQAARLKCEAIGDPPLETNWLRDKSPLYVAEEPRYTVSRSQLADGMVSELNIIETDRSDSALFTCLAQNHYGNDDTNVQLIVQAPPDPPADIRIHEYQARSVKISWSASYTGNSPITKYVVMYAQLAPVLGIGQAAQVAPQAYTNVTVGGNESSLHLQGLIPLTEYQFHVLAVNALGASRLPGEPTKFRTDDEAPSGQPQMVKGQALSSRSIRVRWRAPERRAHFGAIAGFYVGYKQQQQQQPASAGSQPSADTFVYKTVELVPAFDNSGPFSSQRNQSNGVGGGPGQSLDQECVLQGLKRNRKYIITVQAFNGRGAGPASEPIVAETWRIDVPAPPSLRLIARTTHSIHLAWRLAGAAAAPEAAGGHQALVMRKSIAEHIKSKQFGQIQATTPVMDIDLEPDQSSFGTRKQQRFGDDAGANDELAMDADDQELQALEPILGYILTRKQMSAIGQQQQQSLDLHQPVEMRLPADHLSQIVDNLICGTRYQFTIAAMNSMGSSAPSEPLVVKTEGSLPVAPDKNSLLSMNSSMVLINLNTWHNGACAMRSFEVMFKASRSKKWTPLASHQVATSQQPTMSPQQVAGNTTAVNPISPASASQLAQRSTYSSNSNNNNAPGQQSVASQQASAVNATTIVLEDLSSTLNYDLRILATNEAGSTEAFYTFNTNGGSSSIVQRNGADDQQWVGSDFSDSGSLSDLLTGGAGPMLTWLLLLLFASLFLSTGCFVLARRRHTSSSNCSLSLSSASRSNQSTGNYYTTTAGSSSQQQHQELLPKDKNANTTLQKEHHLQAVHQQSMASDSPLHQTLIGHHHQTANMLHLNDIYGHQRPPPSSSSSGHHQQQQQPQQQHPSSAHLNFMDQKSPYAYLATSSGQRRATSPHGTDMTSVINGGSETEMCLGASALNIAHQVELADKQRAADPQQQPQQQVASYYVTPMLIQHTTNQQQQDGSIKSTSAQLGQLGKSSTLPANCHQQILQQLLQQQQQQQQHQVNQQMIDSLVAANMLQQQQQQVQCNADNYLAMPAGSTDQPNNDLQQYQQQQQHVNMATLIEQQAYATVRRGARPPRLCDFTIYQQPLNNNLEQMSTVMRCCPDMQLTSAIAGGPEVQHACYHPAEQQQPQTATLLQQQQQQQSQSSDYQQLRPVN